MKSIKDLDEYITYNVTNEMLEMQIDMANFMLKFCVIILIAGLFILMMELII